MPGPEHLAALISDVVEAVLTTEELTDNASFFGLPVTGFDRYSSGSG
jgi:hypothetical protein